MRTVALAFLLAAVPVAAHAEDILTPGQVRAVPDQQLRDPKGSPGHLKAVQDATAYWDAVGHKADVDAAEAFKHMTIEESPAQTTCRRLGFKLDQMNSCPFYTGH